MFRRKRNASDFDAEIEAHIQLETERLQEQGLSEEDARAGARRAFGNVTRAQERFYESGRWVWWDHLWQDIRYGLRMVAKQPGFTAVAVLTLALGIGANTAIFSVVYSVLLRNLPFPDPGRLVFIWIEAKDGRKFLSGPDFMEFQDQVTAFTGVAAIRGQWMVHLSGDGRPEVVRLRPVSPNFLAVYGLQPYIGRDFRPEDDIVIPFEAAGNPDATLPTSAAMISYGLWQSRFGGDPNVIGKLIQLELEPYQIIGVAPPHLKTLLPDEEDQTAEVQVWTLSGMDFRRMPRDVAFLRVVARLKPGVTLEQAQTQGASFAEHQRREYPVHRENGYEVRVVPLQRELTRAFRTPVLVLFGAVFFVLLIACTNLANLLLARGSSRRREFAVRLALGSGRTRLIRQVLTESWLYALLGAGAGLLLAIWLEDFLLLLAPRSVPRMNEIGVNGPVLAFTLGISMLAALLLGLLPALRFSGPKVLAALRDAGRGTGESGHRRRDAWLVVGQVALSVILVIGTGLLLRSLVLLLRVDPGFRPDSVLTAEMTLSSRKYPRYPSSQARVRFARQLSERLSRLPGVQAVGLTLVIPLSRQDAGHTYATEEMAKTMQTFPPAKYRPVTPGYFQAAGTQLLAGRDFTWADLEQERLVVIVDETLARKAWPGQAPVGKRLRVEVWSTRGRPIHLEPLWTEVIGVVQNVHSKNLGSEDRETVYLPYDLYATAELSVLVRSAADPGTLIGPVRREIQFIDGDMTAFNFRGLGDFVWDAMAPQRFSLTLLGAFGALGLLLAAIGLYGVLHYSVSHRVHEIGVRMALGARPRDVLRLVLAQGIMLSASGVLLGLGGAFALTHWIQSQLYHVSPTDPTTFAGVIALIFLVSLLACYLPARRATKVDPMVALRCE